MILNKECYERGCAAYDDRVDEGVVLTNGEEDMKAFPSTDDTIHDRGMDLRDYFAAKAMQGMLSNPMTLSSGSFHGDNIDVCYQIADEMMKAREEK